MRKLAGSADAILMDLRSFSPQNQGCMYEVHQLLDSVPLERVVFLLDDATDRVFLEQSLQDAWSRVRSDSPNRGATARAKLLRVGSQQAADVRGLLKLLFGVPASTRPAV